MHTPSHPRTLATSARPHLVARHVLSRWSLAAAALVCCNTSQAIDFGPFSLTGFAKAEFGIGNSQCPDCQLLPLEDKQRAWADELAYGAHYGNQGNHVTLVQPYLGAKFDLGRGFKLSGLLSQRWRNGKEDIKGFWYEKNIALSHEDYGSVRVGAMTTRAWSVADYPYGTNVGVADVWGASGAGYGLLTNAVRYSSRLFDVADGDLLLEATYDGGKKGWSLNKPRFVEIYAQFHRGDLVVDAMVQDTRNGTPSAWGHGPFTGLTPFPADDSKLGGSGQSIAMAMARYQVDSRIEVSGGIRRNRWSGAYAVITQGGGADALWNNMFNVDWDGVLNKGYPATSVDVMLGVRYRMGQWTASSGLVHLGTARTDNPSERGQSNSATVGTIGLNYDWGHGVQLYTSAAMVQYGRLGLAPMSMPGNAAFTNVDSRVTKTGSWFLVGAVYVF